MVPSIQKSCFNIPKVQISPYIPSKMLELLHQLILILVAASIVTLPPSKCLGPPPGGKPGCPNWLWGICGCDFGLSWRNEVSTRQNPDLPALLSQLEPLALWDALGESISLPGQLQVGK